mmetsp:Transcript_29834/g.45531  ORF Transcript_29834/g.45531 Transcript_29834/m.45531 type:complete len:364 (-) Transcript_29834:90-1181(-)
MDSVVGLFLHLLPEGLFLFQALFGFTRRQFLEKLVSSEHMALNVGVFFHQLVVGLQLPEVASVGVVNEVESVRSRGGETALEDRVSFSVLEHEMDIDLLLASGCLGVQLILGPEKKIVFFLLVFRQILIEEVHLSLGDWGRLCSNEGLAALPLRSQSPYGRVASELFSMWNVFLLNEPQKPVEEFHRVGYTLGIRSVPELVREGFDEFSEVGDLWMDLGFHEFSFFLLHLEDIGLQKVNEVDSPEVDVSTDIISHSNGAVWVRLHVHGLVKVVLDELILLLGLNSELASKLPSAGLALWVGGRHNMGEIVDEAVDVAHDILARVSSQREALEEATLEVRVVEVRDLHLDVEEPVVELEHEVDH